MWKFLKLSLLCSVIIFSACGTTKKLISVEEEINFSVFEKSNEALLYKTNILVMKNDLSGIAVIKTDSIENRLIFMNQTGITFFDFSYFPDSMKINYIASFLSKPIIANTFLNTFSDLFSEVNKNCFVSTNEETFVCDKRNVIVKESRIKEIRNKIKEVTTIEYEGATPLLITIIKKRPKVNVTMKHFRNN